MGGKNGEILSMRMQVILDSLFHRPGSAPIWGGRKGEFRDWTKRRQVGLMQCVALWDRRKNNLHGADGALQYLFYIRGYVNDGSAL